MTTVSSMGAVDDCDPEKVRSAATLSEADTVSRTAHTPSESSGERTWTDSGLDLIVVCKFGVRSTDFASAGAKEAETR
jgi:hypothetical protein